jgi:hypothetical protein
MPSEEDLELEVEAEEIDEDRVLVGAIVRFSVAGRFLKLWVSVRWGEKNGERGGPKNSEGHKYIYLQGGTIPT